MADGTIMIDKFGNEVRADAVREGTKPKGTQTETAEQRAKREEGERLMAERGQEEPVEIEGSKAKDLKQKGA
jgi:hypothetical protein